MGTWKTILWISLLSACPIHAQSGDTTRILAAADSLFRIHEKYLQTERLDSAMWFLNEATALVETNLDTIHLRRGQLLHSKGWLLLKSGSLDNQIINFSQEEEAILLAAEQNLSTSLRIKEIHLGKEHPSIGITLNELGNAYCTHNRFDEAENCYLAALHVFEKTVGPLDERFGWVLNNLALLCFETQRFYQAEQYMFKAIEVKESIKGIDAINLSNSYAVLADIYDAIGDVSRAEVARLKINALLLQENSLEDIHYYWKMNNVGSTYFKIGDTQRAISYYKEAITGKRRLLGNSDPDVAFSLLLLGNVYGVLDSIDLADKYYRESLNIYALDTVRFEWEISWLLNNLGMNMIYLGKYGEAEVYLEAALAKKEKLIGRQNEDWYTTYTNLIVAEFLQGSYESAEQKLLANLEYMRGDIMSYRRSYENSTSALVELYYSWEKASLARIYLDSLLKIDKKNILEISRHITPLALYGYLEKAKWRMSRYYSLSHLPYMMDLEYGGVCYNLALFYKGFLSDEIERKRRDIASVSGVNDLTDEIRFKQFQLNQALTSKTADQAQIDRLEEEVKVRENHLLQALGGNFSPQPDLHWHQVQSALGTGDAAIEFVDYQLCNPFGTDSVYYAAMLLTRESRSPVFIPLFEENKFLKSTEAASVENQAPLNQLYGLSINDHTPGLLFDYVWKPILPYLHNIRTVYYASSGILHYINLAAIYTDQQHVITDKYELIKMNSTRQLALPRKSELGLDDCVLFGGIQYEQDTTLINDTQTESDTMSIVLRGEIGFSCSDSTLRGGTWGYLKGSQKEVVELASILEQSGVETTMLKGVSATEEAFKSFSASIAGNYSPRIIHISTHGYFFPDSRQHQSNQFNAEQAVFKTSDHPMIRSGLILAGGNYAWTHGHPYKTGMEDGILTAYEISQMDLSNTELVVLSACETGLGDIKGNEGVFGLQRAFKIAGAKNLIMSLWKVPDAATAELMISFYKHWLEAKMTIRQALYTAQKELRDDGFEPYYWAGWVLVE